MTGEARFFEVPATDVDERVRRQATAWAERAAADLGLAGLGIPAVAVRWFLAPSRLRFVHPGRKELDVFAGPPSLAGLCRPQDPPGTIWLRADLEPTLAHQQLAHYVAHELMHARSHALGRPWPWEDQPDAEAEARCEAFAKEFCTRLRAGVRSREERAMPGLMVLNNRVVPETEVTYRRRVKARLRGLVGSGEPFSALAQGAARADSAAAVGGLIAAWERGAMDGTLTPAQVAALDAALRTAVARLSGLEGEAGPAQAKAAPAWPAKPPRAAAARESPRSIEYSQPVPIGRVW